MEEFYKKLNEASNALIQLSAEFERLETDHADLLSEGYPFSICLREVVHHMMNWQETINDLMEATKHAEKADI